MLAAWALGTNMALYPHREDDFRKPYYRFAHAYRDPDGLFRTLMGKACEGCGPRIPRFSNPDLSYEGRPTGTAKGDPDWSNNARALNRVRRVAADFDRFPCVADPDASCRGE